MFKHKFAKIKICLMKKNKNLTIYHKIVNKCLKNKKINYKKVYN